MASGDGTKLDAVVFGATGFTGKYTVIELAKLAKEKGNIKWGVAGRNKEKLEKLLADLSEKTGADLKKIPVLVADVSDEASLKEMAASTLLVINCVGPYRFYGEAVVKACVAEGCHHVDVSGEPQYMERMQLNYHDAAKEKGVYVVSACGFDSIPADLGTVFLTKNFQGDVNSVETYLEWRMKKNVSGPSIHFGTFESAVFGLANARELRPLREKLFPKRLPQMLPKQKPRWLVHKSSVVGKWCLPFPGSDRSVVMRSQRHFFEQDKQRPVQAQAYVAFHSLLAVVGVVLVGGVIGVLSRSNLGRKLLLKYPGFFTGGMVSHEGPSEELMENTEFSLMVRGEGWQEKLAEPTDQHSEPPNKTMTVKVKGTNPGYGATCTMLVMSALTILKEADKMPGRGGVYPPGAAFANTSLVEELDKHGVTFQVSAS
ncbi:saccharopine dehydrogenase-like oxidoreductase [Bacillus rossius redtenbacheri]|uniref:saccharopine dehydrogenase-like oxidoreductase n=1 Tax=Bacillus rossius redtenbacheri TaxID=93214 RepID=UPI002FDEDBEF